MLLLSDAEASLSRQEKELIRERAAAELAEGKWQLEVAGSRVIPWGFRENDYLVGLIGKQ